MSNSRIKKFAEILNLDIVQLEKLRSKKEQAMTTILEHIQKSGFSPSEIADLSGLSRAYAFIAAKDGIKRIGRSKLMQLAIGLNLSLVEIESLLATHGYKKIEWSDSLDVLMLVRERKISSMQPVFSGFSQLISLMTLELMFGKLICLGSNMLDIFAPDSRDNWRLENPQTKPREDVYSEIWRHLQEYRKMNLESHLSKGESIKLLLSEADLDWYIQNQAQKETLPVQFQEMFTWMEKFPKFEVTLVEDSGLQYELKLHPTKESESAVMIMSLDSLDFSGSGRLIGICSKNNSLVRSVRKECERFSPVGEIKETVERLIETPLNAGKSD